MSAMDVPMGDLTEPIGERPLDDPREISTWLEDFWAALHVATKSEFRNSEALRESVRELSRLRNDLARTDAARPFARAVRAAQAMADTCAAMVQHYLRAIVAGTPLAAQDEADSAQQSLNELAIQGEALMDWLDRQETLSRAESLQESLGLLVADCFAATSTGSLLDLAKHFQAQLADVAGGEPGPDAAISYGLNAAFVDLFLSPEEFHRKVRGGVELLLAADERIQRMLSDAEFQADAQRLRLELFDSGVACQSAIAKASHPRQSARAVVELHATLVEAAGMVLALPYLTAAGQKNAPYTALRRGNATEHLQRAHDNPVIADLLAGMDGHLRTAQSHRAISYGEQQLTTDLKSGQKSYQYSDLIDATFLAVESALAGLMAIQLVCSTNCWIEPDDTGLDALGFSPMEAADFLLTSFGFPHSSTRMDGETLKVAPQGSIVGFTVAVGALLPSMTTGSFNAIQVTTQDGTTWRSPVEPYEMFRSASDDFAKQVALMRVQWSWRSDDGFPWLPAEALRKWTATQITETLDLESHERFRRLLLLRKLADEVGAQDVANLVRSHVRLARLQLVGQAAGEPERAALETVISWATSDVDFELI